MNIKLFISERNGFIHYRDENNNIIPVQILQDNVIKLSKDLVITENTTGYRIVLFPTTDGTATYRLVSAPVSHTTFSTGGGGRKGVNVFDDGTLQGFTSNLNFTGAGVTVTIVNGQAVIDIPGGGGGTINGGGTLNFIAKFTPDGTTIGDSLLFDNGTTVQMGGVGAIPSAQFAMTSTTQGFLAPRMTTGERNLIGAPATGLLVYNTSTSLFSYWDGAAWQNIDSQAGGDVSGSGVTGNISYWTDGPNSVLGDTGIAFGNVYIQNGNSFGADAFIGTNDAFSFNFETSSSLRGTIGPTGLWGINTAPVAATLLSVQGIGITSATSTLSVFNSGSATALMKMLDNGLTGFNTNSPIAALHIRVRDSFYDALQVDDLAGDTRFVVQDAGPIGISIPSASIAADIHVGSATAIGNGMRFDGSSQGITFTDNAAGFITNSGAAGWIKINGTNSVFDLAGTNGNDLRIGTDGLATAGKGIYLKAFSGTNWRTGLKYLNVAAGEPNLLLVPDGFGNVGIGSIASFGTSAQAVLGIFNGTEPSTSPADMIQIFSVNVDTAGTNLASLGLRTEEAVSLIDVTVPTFRLRVKINGTERYLLLGTVV